LDWLNVFFPTYYPSNPPQTMLEPSIEVGQCWPMAGTNGTVVVELGRDLQITSIGVQHIPRSLAPDPTTAPKKLRFYGYTANQWDKAPTNKIPEGELLGSLDYQVRSSTQEDLAQYVHPMKDTRYKYVRLEVLNNYGNPNYTCLYRFHVHGKPIE